MDASGNISLDMTNKSLQEIVDIFRSGFYHLNDTNTIVLLCFYIPVFIVSLCGNILVLVVIVLHKSLWSSTNNFLMNLAVADLLVTVLCIPMTVAQRLYSLWIYGDVLCKVSPYLQGVAVVASTLTITAMSVDRCLSIQYPMKFRRYRTSRHVRILVLSIWCVSHVAVLPVIIHRRIKIEEIGIGEHFQFCIEQWDKRLHGSIYNITLLIIVCLVPGIIVVIAYSRMSKTLLIPDKMLAFDETADEKLRSKRTSVLSEKNIRIQRKRMAKLCLSVAVLFFLCWLPYYVINVYVEFTFDTKAVTWEYYSLLLGHVHSATNPVIYCFIHKSFRKYLAKIFLDCTVFRKRRDGSMITRSKHTHFVVTPPPSSFRSTRSSDVSSERQIASTFQQHLRTLDARSSSTTVSQNAEVLISV